MRVSAFRQINYPISTTTSIRSGSRCKRDGYGLGLSIVKHLVKLLSLKLDARSEAGRGSTFSLLLPASSVPVLTVHRALTVSPASRPRQIGERHVLLQSRTRIPGARKVSSARDS